MAWRGTSLFGCWKCATLAATWLVETHTHKIRSGPKCLSTYWLPHHVPCSLVSWAYWGSTISCIRACPLALHPNDIAAQSWAFALSLAEALVCLDRLVDICINISKLLFNTKTLLNWTNASGWHTWSRIGSYRILDGPLESEQMCFAGLQLCMFMQCMVTSS